MSDTPMAGANEFDGEDDDIVNDGSNGFDWHKAIPWILGLAALITAGLFGWDQYQQNQLPAAFTARPGDSVMTYVVSSKDPIERARIAVRAAELTRQPVLATELCGQSVQRVPGQCGRPHEVTYKQARSLARFPGTVMLNVPLYPGDFMDARKGIYIGAVQPITELPGVTVTAPAT